MADVSLKDKIAQFGAQVGGGLALFGLASSVLYWLDYSPQAAADDSEGS